MMPKAMMDATISGQIGQPAASMMLITLRTPGDVQNARL
jgi:asparagine synthetase A